MIISIKPAASEKSINELREYFKENHLETKMAPGINYNVCCVLGDTSKIDENFVKVFDCVDDVKRISKPYKLASRLFHPQDTIVKVKNLEIGGKNIVFMAGPCSIEGEASTMTIAKGVKEAGGNILRGGAYKPRSSPYAFQGLQTEGILDMVKASKQYDMPIVSEIMSIDKLDEFIKYVDIIQVGARNMQNFELLKALGKIDKPILLKRGLSATIEEWLMAAEYILSGGNPNVILCERGIRTFEKATRNTLDLSAVSYIKSISHLPVIVDPSHGTGRRELIEPMSLAAIACGADGLMIEVHNNPSCAWSDGAQCVDFQKFEEIVDKAKNIAEVVGRKTY